MFYIKELVATALDPKATQNPFVMGKMPVDSVRSFDFTPFMGYIDPASAPKPGDISTITQKNFSNFYKTIGARTSDLDFPSMLALCCNSIEVLRLRHNLLNAIEQTLLLEDVYQKQAKMLGREAKINYTEPMNISSYLSSGQENFVNFVEDGPGSDIEVKCAINEFDKALRSAINFADPESFKALIMPLGLEELRAVVQYELMNLQILIVAVKTNQVQMDNMQRKLCEIQFFQDGYTIANPVFDLYSKLQGQNLMESKLNKLPALERSAANTYLTSKVSKGFYNILERKGRMKEAVEKTFKLFKTAASSLKEQKVEVTTKQLRALKLIMCHDYAQDVLARVYHDAIKLQILQCTDTLRKRIYMLPRDCIFLELSQPLGGEHQFAAYNEDDQAPKDKNDTLFYNQNNKHILSFFRLPSFQEILSLEFDIDAFKQVNMPKNFVYDLGNLQDFTLPEIVKNEEHLPMIRAKVQKVTLTESRDVETVVKERHRMVEFAEAYDYSNSVLLKYLKYWKYIQNIFDLEFFVNKLASSAFVVSNVEKYVLSGIPFYEEGDDTLFGENSETEQDEDETGKRKKDGFDKDGHKPLKNELALKVAEKIANEKREKMQLIQDLETIKDKFTEYKVIMKKQEMGISLARAETFLGELHSIMYYSILVILYQMQDSYFKEKKGQKEIQTINEVVMNLSHQQDLKVTYTNGFHVNYAITDLQRLDLDSNHYNQEFDSFFKLTQPIVDEEGLNPPEYNLVQGIYLTNAVNLVTFKKNIPYMGNLFNSDYKCLDYALTNMSKSIRKYFMTNFGSIDMTLSTFIMDKMKYNDKEYQSNPTIYASILAEKKNYLRTQVKARQSRRVLMMVINKKVIPTDIDEYNEMYQAYYDDVQWKLMHHLDQIAAARTANHQREVKNMLRKNPGAQVQSAMKAPKESQAMKVYDQASTEVLVIQNELQKYMIQTSFEMFQKESDALAKAFEMTNTKMCAFIHPVQQFASTFHQNVDKRSHLDIINKVGPIQKMLTQIKNRCLEIETLTSGTGIVISSKDLNEVLEECCRSLIKYGEIEMRTRCEYLSLNLIQYENLIYVKDRQLLNLENKLSQAKIEMNKIVNTKVFSRGNNLIYELDMTNRQLRMLKDNIFLLEKNLTEKIKLCYDKQLDETRQALIDMRIQEKVYHEQVDAKIAVNVREQVNKIDGIMKKMANNYKDLKTETRKEMALKNYMQDQKDRNIIINNTTININDVHISKGGLERDIKDKDGKPLKDENGKIKREVVDTVIPATGVDPKILEEFENLKKIESEIRKENEMLMTCLRRQRKRFAMQEVLMKERHQLQIDNLKQQLTSNTTLWEQLAESEKREKILKQEIERAQQEIATQEKIIERLKDDIKKEGREKQKLLQYKNTKSKRLDELESKAREFEVLSSVNLNKILGLLESKERKINQLSQSENNSQNMLNALNKLNAEDIKNLKKKMLEETKFKTEAISKLEGLRQELNTIQGSNEQPSQSVVFWKEQCQNLFDICRNLKEDNEKLVDHLNVGGSVNHQYGFDNSILSNQPNEQFGNNQDLLSYLNSQHNALPPHHRRAGSQQPQNLSARNTYDLAFGMNQQLQDHMLGKNRTSRAGGSSINSLHSEQRDSIISDPNKFALPKIGMGRNNLQFMTEQSSVMQGSVASQKYNLAQNSPFMNNSQMPRGAIGTFGPGNNVFQTLQGGSVNTSNGKQMSVVIPGQQESKQHIHTSIDITTNPNTSFRNSPGGNPLAQHSVGMPIEGNPEITQNIFNFAPHTQRTPINLDHNQDSLNLPARNLDQDLKSSGLNEFGELTGSVQEMQDQQNTPGQSNKREKRAEMKLVTQLQPKLINPPSKLTKNIQAKGMQGSYKQKKNDNPLSKELNNY